MRYFSVFSGIEAASVAWAPLGWECVGVAEVEKFPCAVLAHHYPTVPNLGDVTKITKEQIEALGRIDVVVGGFPCQDVSVAGKRAGLHHEATGTATRSGLFFDAMRIVEWSRARFVVIENVPGLFSSKSGRDFAAVVGALAGVGFGVPRDGWKNSGVAAGPLGLVEWACLDARYFGVPQRRRRVFLVRDSGDWRSRSPILFERESLRGDPAPSREAGERIAPSLEARTRGGGGGWGTAVGGMIPEVAGPLQANGKAAGSATQQDAEQGMLVAYGGNRCGGHQDVHTALKAHPTFKGDFESETMLVSHALRADGFDASEDGTGRGTPLVPIAIQERAVCENPDAGPDGVGIRTDGQAYTIEARTVPQAVAFQQNSRSEVRFIGGDGQIVGALSAEPGMKQQNYIAFSSKDHGADAGETSPTLRSMGHDGSHANGGGQVAIAFNIFPTGGQGAALEATETELSSAISPVTHGKTTDRGTRIVTGFIHPRQLRGSESSNQLGIKPYAEVSDALTSEGPGAVMVSPQAFESRFARNGRGAPSDVVPPLKAQSGQSGKGDAAPLVAFTPGNITRGAGASPSSEVMQTLKADHGRGSSDQQPHVLTAMQVRRITPLEAERLQGFPDGWTAIPFNGRTVAADGPRYKSLGNSMAVPVMAYIGRRIQLVSDLAKERQ